MVNEELMTKLEQSMTVSMSNEGTLLGNRVIIAGGRDFTDAALVEEAMWQLYGADNYGYDSAYMHGFTVISGGAKGADTLGEMWAKANGFPIERYLADWDQYGTMAGPIRNEDMAKVSNVLVAFWDGRSRGTKNMIHTALDKGLEVHVYRY